MKPGVFTRLLTVAALLGAAFPVSAAAAEDPPAVQSTVEQGQVIIRQVHNDLVAGPEVRFGRVGNRDATLVGGSLGVLVDRTLLVGGAGYWLANGSRGFALTYGGLVVEWYVLSDRPVTVSVRGLVGGGEGRVTENTALPADRCVVYGSRGVPPVCGGAVSRIDETAFFVAEPQVGVVWQIADRVAVSAGVGYRLIGAASGFEDRFRGIYGTAGITFGASKR